jgi:hypothetical protein
MDLAHVTSAVFLIAKQFSIMQSIYYFIANKIYCTITILQIKDNIL